MTTAERAIVAPEPTPETQGFWDRATEGQLLIRRCSACQRAHWYPRASCPFCFSDQTSWHNAAGRGVIYSFSITRRIVVPYAIAYVTLEEGPTMLTNIVDCDLEALHIGQPVRVVFKKTADGIAIPMFTPTP